MSDNPTDPRPPRSRPLRGLVCTLVVGALLVAMAACGEPERGGHGRLQEGGLRILEVGGSPYEMGYWHGRLLRDEIRDLVGPWTRHNLRLVTGGGDGSAGASAEVLEHLRHYAETSLWQLPEQARQEIEGLSEGSGVAALDLVQLGLLQDALRVHVTSQGPFLPGALAAWLPAGDAKTPRRSFATWRGSDAAFLEDRWVLIHRKPDVGPETVVLTTPGSLGMVAGITGTRREVLVVETESSADLRGFGRGVPVGLGARLAMERSPKVGEVFGGAGGTSGHAMVVLEDVRDDDARTAGRGAVLLYRGTQAWIDLDDRPWIVMGPSQAVESGLAAAQLWEPPEVAPAWDEVTKRAAALLDAEAAPGPTIDGARTADKLEWHVRLPTQEGALIQVAPDGTIRIAR